MMATVKRHLSVRSFPKMGIVRQWLPQVGAIALLLGSIAAPAPGLAVVLAEASRAQSVPQTGSKPAPAASSPPLRIATRLVRPDAFEENGQLVGFSIDLSQGILGELQRDAEIKPYGTLPELLTAVQTGQADLGIAAIAITRQREQQFEFSHPILSASLQIMVRSPANQTRTVEQELIHRLLDPNLVRLVAIVALLMLLPAHMLWYFERGNKDGVISNGGYIPGIFQALWWTILALIGQTDKMPNGPVGKTVGLFWVLVGIVFIAYFTATITAELTVQELRGEIQELSDLRDRPIALVADAEAATYLTENDITQVQAFSQFEPAYEALMAGEVEAIVASRPLLQYHASQIEPGQVQLVGVPFREQFYAIVMPKDSPYRKPINQAILTLKENGTYQTLYRQWVGSSSND
jgi:polar amino acid transport system substrate-binding protein